MLNAEIERLSKLVIDLLEIFRVDSQLTESDLQPVSIFKLIQESLKAAGCEIEVTCNDLYSHILVNADKKRFERVVANIVYNAQTYADGLKSVTISKLVDTVIIYFDDDGPGIDRAHRNQVFERFNRGVRSGSRGLEKGTGLGLALVAKIVSGHKGKVSIDSSLSGGARIIIELPIFIPKS
jgi:signal transduction histidine kinase